MNGSNDHLRRYDCKIFDVGLEYTTLDKTFSTEKLLPFRIELTYLLKAV